MGSLVGIVALLVGVVALAIWVGLHTDETGKRFDTEWRGELHQLLSPDYRQTFDQPDPADHMSGPSAEQ